MPIDGIHASPFPWARSREVNLKDNGRTRLLASLRSSSFSQSKNETPDKRDKYSHSLQRFLFESSNQHVTLSSTSACFKRWLCCFFIISALASLKYLFNTPMWYRGFSRISVYYFGFSRPWNKTSWKTLWKILIWLQFKDPEVFSYLA